MKIEGGLKDYELPEINEDVPCDLGTPSSSGEELKKYNEMVKECTLLKEEHKANVKDLNVKIEELELQVRLKSDKAGELQKMMTSKDADI